MARDECPEQDCERGREHPGLHHACGPSHPHDCREW